MGVIDKPIELESAYEFAQYKEYKPHIYCLIDATNRMHIRMYLTEDQYKLTPEFRQKLYKVCS